MNTSVAYRSNGTVENAAPPGFVVPALGCTPAENGGGADTSRRPSAPPASHRRSHAADAGRSSGAPGSPEDLRHPVGDEAAPKKGNFTSGPARADPLDVSNLLSGWVIFDESKPRLMGLGQADLIHRRTASMKLLKVSRIVGLW